MFLTSIESRFIGAGAEQKVYLDPDGATVLKVNKGRFHTTWLDYFNRLLIHAFLFPATNYVTAGFTTDEGEFAVITRQPYATLETGTTRESVASYLEQQKYCRLRNDDYCNQSIGVRLEDLHDENVFQDREENLLSIDPVIYFETADLKLGGELVFRFPFAK